MKLTRRQVIVGAAAGVVGATGIYELDFNRAYHPYCYYNATYECPLPPRENRLKIPIHAGERMKKSEVGSLK